MIRTTAREFARRHLATFRGMGTIGITPVSSSRCDTA
jgi:hypothetical protein